jgi:hypothetical protein
MDNLSNASFDSALPIEACPECRDGKPPPGAVHAKLHLLLEGTMNAHSLAEEVHDAQVRGQIFAAAATTGIGPPAIRPEAEG